MRLSSLQTLANRVGHERRRRHNETPAEAADQETEG